jgi:hypothetical protein
MDRVFVCPKCKSLCLQEDWDRESGRCKLHRRSKYGNLKVEFEGKKFDSEHELNVYLQLKLLERQREIRDLTRQVVFQLAINDILVCKYIADFRYVQAETGKHVIVDAKGLATPVYRLKKKLMKAVHDIDIIEL